MHSATILQAERADIAVPSSQQPARKLYGALLDQPGPGVLADAAAYLARQLSVAAALPCDLPADPADLAAWAAPRHAAVASQYRHYLAGRKAGEARRYFGSKAHALHFLRCVGPTKLADGAWLFGTLAHWEDNAFRPLIKTYLEELGEGLPAKNHVTLYQRLIDNHACAGWDDLSDAHFTQGAIQLSLGHAGARFLPEMVGYNLGYEQLPLHLLITAYELNELGIDPYYFTLHVTVDNADTGHAHDAIDALQRLMACSPNPAEFYRRAREGYKLNELGESTGSVIASFDLESELVRIMAQKARTGKDMHGDYCRVAGKTINAWLADPGQIPALLRAFEDSGWIQRGAPTAESRFWRLIQSERAEMFGVFSSYEQQVLADWIYEAPRAVSFRARQRADSTACDVPERSSPLRALIRNAHDDSASAAGNTLRQIEQAVAQAPTRAAAMRLLTERMSPALHHTAAGLMATRMFARMLP